MHETAVRDIMFVLAALTPLLALFVGWTGRAARAAAGEPEGGETAGRIRRNLWLLAAAGPLNLLVWFLMNRWLRGGEARTVAGYAIAVLVFVAAGFLTGFFGRLRSR